MNFKSMKFNIFLIVSLCWNLKCCNSKLEVVYTGIEFETSDPKILNLDLSIVDIGAKRKGVSGAAYFSEYTKTDFHITFTLLRSSQSTEVKDMLPLPLPIPSYDLRGFMNKVYKGLIMPTVKDCSNLPQFTGDWGQRDLQGNYSTDKCDITTENSNPLITKGNYCLRGVFIKNFEPKLKAELRILGRVE